jgi:hypothetical protein
MQTARYMILDDFGLFDRHREPGEGFAAEIHSPGGNFEIVQDFCCIGHSRLQLSANLPLRRAQMAIQNGQNHGPPSLNIE